jgi:hypothetical protein
MITYEGINNQSHDINGGFVHKIVLHANRFHSREEGFFFLSETDSGTNVALLSYFSIHALWLQLI